MIWLIGLMLLCFVITLLVIQPDLSYAFGGFIPSLPAGSQGLVVAFMASCFSIVGAFYNAYLVQEKRCMNKNQDMQNNGSLIGILILGVLSAIVMICAAAVLHPQHIHVNTATDMSRALAPVFGKYASGLFLIGLFGAAFSSIVGTASIGGTLLGDALGFGSNFNRMETRLLIALVMIIGATIAIIFGRLPLELIVLAQSLTIFIVPVIGIAMYLIANNKNIMGSKVNSLFDKVFGFLGLLIVTALAVINFKEIFLK